MVGGDTLRQLRGQHEAALAAVNERHAAEVLRLQQEVDRLKGGVEQQEGAGGEDGGHDSSTPTSFLGEALLTWVVRRSVLTALSCLLVDVSCSWGAVD